MNSARSILIAVLLAGCSPSPGREVTMSPAAARTVARSDSVRTLGGAGAQPDSMRFLQGALVRVPGEPLRLESHVVRDTPWTVERPDPQTGYGSFTAARDNVERMLRRWLGAYADSAQWAHGEIRFTYRDRMELHRPPSVDAYWTVEDRAAPSLVPSLTMVLDTSTGGGPDLAAISAALVAEGWVEDIVFSSDGPGSTSFAYVCLDALCRVRAQWDVGDDSDSLDVTPPGDHIELICVPRIPERAR